MNRISLIFFFAGTICCCIFLIAANHQKTDLPGEMKPEDALATFELQAGFQIEMVASEPLISDPVAMEIDEDGRMYVVEMHGYPLDKSGSGKVRILSDTNGDGKMDQSTIFAENLVLPTGIMRWKKGVLVTDPPNVLYLEDKDGDGKADTRDTLLTGFAMSNPQHNFNNPILGLDNWIYLGHEPAVTTKTFQKEFGDRGGEIFFPGQKNGPRLPQNGLGRSVRFRPGNLGLEVLSSYTQFGHTFDKWGRYLLVSNANPGYHEVIGNRYLTRNPDLLVSSVTQTISDHSSEVFPITKNPLHQLLTDVGVFTSACGITSYQGGLFPSPYDSITFVAEPVSNLVHADIIRDKGASFTASRIGPNKEFLASTDSWFRPVNMYIGPDGALYVVDYYRQIIEHPEWMADDVVKSGALYNGRDMGRIYRITPKGTPPASWSDRIGLSRASDDVLVKNLANKNIWWRRNAQRLLLDRARKETIPAIRAMASSDPSPTGRLHALWTLEGMGALEPQDLIKALKDSEAGVRENGIKLAEAHFKNDMGLQASLLSLQNDPNAKVRFQLLMTLGGLESPEAAKAREKILFRDINDTWVQTGALTASGSTDALFSSVLKQYDSGNKAYASLVERLSKLTGTRGDITAIRAIIGKALSGNQAQGSLKGKNTGWQSAVLRGLAESLRRNTDLQSLEPERKLLLKAVFDHPQADIRQASIQLLKRIGLPSGKETEDAFRSAISTASNRSAATDKRVEAVQFIALGKVSEQVPLLKKLIIPNEPQSLQIAALKTLSTIPDETVCLLLLEKWPSLTRDVREASIGFFMAGESRIRLLLDGLEKGIVDKSAIGWPRSVGLMAQQNEELRNRARKLLTQKEGQREDVIKAYKNVPGLTGSAQAGKTVFEQNCSVCHQIGGKNGVAFGPDLGTIRNRRPESIMGDILDPNFSIADGYDLWMIELSSGENVQGLISSETPTALTLSNYGGIKKVIARRDIKSLKTLGMSSMPVGLESAINQQQMADLLAFIKQPK